MVDESELRYLRLLSEQYPVDSGGIQRDRQSFRSAAVAQGNRSFSFRCAWRTRSVSTCGP